MPAEIKLEELLEAIQKDGPRKIVQQYRHNLLPSRILIELYSEHPERNVLLFLALYPTVPSQVLEDLAESCPDPEIQAAAATNPRCTHLLLVRMAREGGVPVRAALAANKLQNSKISAELLNDPDLLVRTALAGNGAIGTAYRTALAVDPEPAVRTALSGTGKLAPELIHTLAADDSAVVRSNMIAYGKVEANMLLGWATSDDAATQRLLLERKKPSSEVVEALSHSPDPVVQSAMKGLREPTAQELLAKAESDQEPMRLDAASTRNLPVEIQHVLASDPVAEVRTALAENPGIDEDVALCIAASNDPLACKALANNPQLPNVVKVELCHHESDEVRLQMAYRDDLTDELLEILINEHQDLNLVGHLALRSIRFQQIKLELLETLLMHKRPSLRAFATAASLLTHAQVRKLMRDDSPKVRMALCDNPILSHTALAALTTDWNAGVAEAAHIRLESLPPEPDTESGDTGFEEDGESSFVSRIVKFFTE